MLLRLRETFSSDDCIVTSSVEAAAMDLCDVGGMPLDGGASGGGCVDFASDPVDIVASPSLFSTIGIAKLAPMLACVGCVACGRCSNVAVIGICGRNGAAGVVEEDEEAAELCTGVE